jgi:hypothetical protein
MILLFWILMVVAAADVMFICVALIAYIKSFADDRIIMRAVFLLNGRPIYEGIFMMAEPREMV